MTEFEQQVAEALKVAFGPATIVVYQDGKEIEFSMFDRFAPRVAAAIQAALRVVNEATLDSEGVTFHAEGEPERAALAALRGEQ